MRRRSAISARTKERMKRIATISVRALVSFPTYVCSQASASALRLRTLRGEFGCGLGFGTSTSVSAPPHLLSLPLH
jgi:hypothetical protein